jgi:hypothetical protein
MSNWLKVAGPLATLVAGALLLLPGCSSNQPRDINYGTDVGLGYVPPDGSTAGTGEAGTDGGDALSFDSSLTDGSDVSMGSTYDASNGAADTSSADASLSAAAQQYVTTYAEPYCTRLAACCSQTGITFSGLGPCEANQLSFVPYLDDGSEVIVPGAIQTLLDQVQTSCYQPSGAVVSAITNGTRLSGQPCVAVDQCAGTPALCLLSSDLSSGTCMTPPRGKAGDGCAVTCDDTTLCEFGTNAGRSPYSACYDQDGLRCDSTTYSCVVVTAIGASCSEDFECGAHAVCTNGACQAMATLGEDCSGGQTCDTNLECVGVINSAIYTCQELSIAWSGSCSP